MFIVPSSSGASSASSAPKNDILVYELEIPLEKVATGCRKRVKVTRPRILPDGTRVEEEIVLTIDVKPGWRPGTTITFANAGSQTAGHEPEDLTFVLKDEPHPVFKRDGVDIKYTARISLKEALCGCSVLIPTLDGKKLLLKSGKEVITPHMIHRIVGYGLPHSKDTLKKGDLVVDFNIEFPKPLTSEAYKLALVEILQ